MGLFNKLKNVLFEVEEIEVPVEEPKAKPIVKEEVHPKIDKHEIKMTFNDSDDTYEPPKSKIISDRELFKAEKTFDFPFIDDNEFAEIETPKKEPVKEEKPKSMSINLFDYERPKVKKEPIKPEKKAEEIRGRAYPRENRTTFSGQKFRPSPVISPVYGVLNKNYIKEDIIVEKNDNKPEIDVDVVRKKAFGTLESDLEKTLNEPIDDFFHLKEEEPKETLKKEEKKIPVPRIKEEIKPKIKEEPLKEEKSIEDLLEETAEGTIDIPKRSREKIDLPKEEKEIMVPETRETEVDDTLESDLFDLIDSMYEDRKDEE